MLYIIINYILISLYIFIFSEHHAGDSGNVSESDSVIGGVSEMNNVCIHMLFYLIEFKNLFFVVILSE
jgi:hypothetical protein